MRIGWPWIVGSCLLVSLVAPAASLAQRGSGTTPIGRRGYEWQVAQDAAKEEQKRLEGELAAMSEEDWKSHALAWIELQPGSGDGQLQVPDSKRVGGLEVKKAEVQADEDHEGGWTIAWTHRKAPKVIDLVLTDVKKTKVPCPLRSTLENGDVALGIFQSRTGVLLCIARAKGSGSAPSG